jgi:hypothetical protein
MQRRKRETCPQVCAFWIANTICFLLRVSFASFALQSEDLMRQLVELGYRGSGEALKRSVHGRALAHCCDRASNPFAWVPMRAALFGVFLRCRVSDPSLILFLLC